MAHKRLRKLRKEAESERTALLFASAQLAADSKTFNHLLDSRYTDINAIMHALPAIEGTRRIIADAIRGKEAIS